MITKLKPILIKSKRKVFSEKIGNNPSPFKGEGYDFMELREYMPGDDIKFIDWNITAKMQQPYVKVFHEERELNITLVSILNGSVHFGSTKFKQEVIAEIIALLSYSAIKNSDTFSSFIFTNKQEYYHKPSKKLHAVHSIIENILSFDSLKKGIDFEVIANLLYKRLKRKSLIFIVGDFFEIPNFKLLAKKHEVIAIIVRDKLEENPPPFGLASLQDPQSGNNLDGDFTQSAVNSYKEQLNKHDQILFEKFKKDSIRYTKIYTDDPIWKKLKQFL